MVWECTDNLNKFKAHVVRKSDYKGTWQFIRLSDGAVLKEEEVHLSFAARFGPDVDDANRWLKMAEYASVEFDS